MNDDYSKKPIKVDSADVHIRDTERLNINNAQRIDAKNVRHITIDSPARLTINNAQSERNEAIRRTLAVWDVWLLVAFIILAGSALAYYFLYNEKIVDNHSITLTQHGQVWDVRVNFTSYSVFSAQTELTVDVIATPDDNKFHPDVSILFLTAVDPVPQYFMGSVQNVEVPLTFDSEKGWYKGTGNIMFTSEGPKCVRLSAKSLKTNDNSSSPYDNATAIRYPGQCPFINEKSQIEFDPIIHISSADAKYQYQTNKATIALALVAAGIASLSLRTFLGQWLRDRLTLPNNNEVVDANQDRTNNRSDNSS